MDGRDGSIGCIRAKVEADEQCQVKAGETHQIAVKNLKQAGGDLWSFHFGKGPVHVKSSRGACSGSRKSCLSV